MLNERIQFAYNDNRSLQQSFRVFDEVIEQAPLVWTSVQSRAALASAMTRRLLHVVGRGVLVALCVGMLALMAVEWQRNVSRSRHPFGKQGQSDSSIPVADDVERDD